MNADDLVTYWPVSQRRLVQDVWVLTGCCWCGLFVASLWPVETGKIHSIKASVTTTWTSIPELRPGRSVVPSTRVTWLNTKLPTTLEYIYCMCMATWQLHQGGKDEHRHQLQRIGGTSPSYITWDISMLVIIILQFVNTTPAFFCFIMVNMHSSNSF